MLATPNSWGGKPTNRSNTGCQPSLVNTFNAHWLLVVAMLFFVGAPNTLAGTGSPLSTNAPTRADFLKQTEQAYQKARARFRSSPNDPEAAWQFGRASFDWADYATSDDQRAEIAQQGIAACRRLIESQPESALGHYYLAMDLGQLAQTRSLGALKIVDQMEEEFKIALRLDPKLDHGGPDRNLGLLYRDAPGWPASIGNKSKAKAHLQAALKLAPAYPDNLLNLIEADLKWGDKKGAMRLLNDLDEIWPEAHQRFAGPEWDPSWADWHKRREAAHRKASASAKTAPHEQP
jgi:tetratricopeptide (TPR) repeat protein